MAIQLETPRLGGTMAFLVVVKRDEPMLFEYLQQHFQEPEVAVLIDRRHGDRRRREGEVADNRRRRQDRRTGATEHDPLWKFGFRVAVAQRA
jgi:hypothetical protein